MRDLQDKIKKRQTLNMVETYRKHILNKFISDINNLMSHNDIHPDEG
jgi:hypothetical protein